VMLHGGDEVPAAVSSEPLAKSGMDPRNVTALRVARARAGYPRGCRHEAASLALIASRVNPLAAAHDPDLVMHLVSSHHGSGRPFLPAVVDLNPVVVSVRLGPHALEASSAHGLERLDSGVGDRFWRLVRRYGWYGLAYLETILRLADHRCSEEEQNRE
jgi:CRISPR-associated endonuclease/helicase Cas3